MIIAIHHSNELIRDPANNTHMFHVLSCKKDDLNEQYQELNNAILQYDFYYYLNIYSYLPINVMKYY